MIGLRFETEPPASGASTHRMDVPLFVGYVARRPGAVVPAVITRWLEARYAVDGVLDTFSAALLDRPIPIDDWATFDRLFAWDARPLGDGAPTAATGHTGLGAAVRGFFAQGGARCYVVRVSDPWPVRELPLGADPGEVELRAARRRRRLARLVPGFVQAPGDALVDPAPAPEASGTWSVHDEATWWGLAHLVGLPEVSMALCPDLAELAADVPEDPAPYAPPPPTRIPAFGPCDAAVPLQEPVSTAARRYPPPTVSRAEAALGDWRDAVRLAIGLVATHRRDVQLIAALPRFAADHPIGRDVHRGALDAGLLEPVARGGLGSAFLQLAHPWVRGPLADALPGAIGPADGVLAGVLARHALTRGVQFSAAGAPVAGLVALDPAPSRADRLRLAPRVAGGAPRDRITDRFTLFDHAAGGAVVLASDMTTSADDDWRPASITRGMAVLVRVASDVGATFTFEPSGEALWRRVAERFDAVLRRWWRQGALRGRTADEAYTVACDRRTMSQSDLDAGRLVCEVRFAPTFAITEITVAMTLIEGGRVVTRGDEVAA